MTVFITDIDNKKVDFFNRQLIDSQGYPIAIEANRLQEMIDRKGLYNFIAFCQRNAIYLYPTQEIILWLYVLLYDYSLVNCLEVGSGDNGLFRFLGIRGTDNYMQTRPEIKIQYSALGQKTTCSMSPAVSGVEKIEALAAIEKYKPKVVIGSWVTPKWDESVKMGNYWGVDYEALLSKVEKYILIGTTNTHGPHFKETFPPDQTLIIPGLISRTAHPETNRVYIWDNSK